MKPVSYRSCFLTNLGVAIPEEESADGGKKESNKEKGEKQEDKHQGSISPTFYEQLSRLQIPKAQKSCLT